MRSLRIRQEFYLVFCAFDKSEFTTRLDRVRFRALSWLYDRGKRDFHDFGHVYIFLKKKDVYACLSRAQWGYFLDVERVKVLSPSLLLTEQEAFGAVLKREYPKSNGIVRVETNISPKRFYRKTIHSGNLCHNVACNVLGIAEKIKSPYGLYKYLVKNGSFVVKEYSNG
jgi:hypothetical protein